MLKAILFDLDNTLLDFSGFKRGSAIAAAKAMRKAGVKAKEKELCRRIWAVYDEKGIEYQYTFRDVLLGYGLDPHAHERALQAAVIAYTKKKYALLRPRPRVISTLSSLRRRFKLGIVTDAPREKAWQRLILSGLDGFFDAVVTYTDTGELKPSSAPFMRACGLLKIKPSEALFVGDNLERDVAGARRVGMRTAWARYGAQGKTGTRGVKADRVLRKFGDLIAAIKE